MVRLTLTGISKQYPAVKANDCIDLAVHAGQIHAVLGENGAGKSTLLKIIYGAVQPDAGQIEWNGKRVRITSPAMARSLGIRMVFQHFSLFDRLTAAENIWLGLDGSLKLSEVTTRIAQVANDYGLDIEPDSPVHALSVGERQRVEIARALMTEPQLLILDEPTSVLTPQAVAKLFAMLRRLAARGCSILYVSHKLDEIRALCDQCTVLRAGRVTGNVDPREQTRASLSRLMIGAEPKQFSPRAANTGSTRLALTNLNLKRNDLYGVDLKDISLAVHAGEILGIAGVSGNGQRELLAALSGEDMRIAAQTLTLDGADLARQGPEQRRVTGLRVVPEERLGRGAVPNLSLLQNTLLTRRDAVAGWGWIHYNQVRQRTREIIARFQIKASGPEALASSLSGGNLQKFIVGRELDAEPKALIVAQPTWGVDVGAAALIRSELLELRDRGCAVLVISEDLEELFEICDRLVVIAQGQLSPVVKIEEATVERIGQWMSGLWHTDGALDPEQSVHNSAASSRATHVAT
jgi:simple sugar transport system ATP-binding protein